MDVTFRGTPATILKQMRAFMETAGGPAPAPAPQISHWERPLPEPISSSTGRVIVKQAPNSPPTDEEVVAYIIGLSEAERFDLAVKLIPKRYEIVHREE